MRNTMNRRRGEEEKYKRTFVPYSLEMKRMSVQLSNST
jgi:hypothetical protein